MPLRLSRVCGIAQAKLRGVEDLINYFYLWIPQGGSAATKDLTADLKLTRYPRSLAATLAACPSVSLFPTARLADNTDRAECVHGTSHCLPACVRELLDSRTLSELGVRGVFASLFDQGGCSPKSDARTRTHSNSPATARRNTTDKICASCENFYR
jgi:hypothetical protein